MGHIHITDGTVNQLVIDSHSATDLTGDGKATSLRNETRVVGYFNQYTNKIYTNVDASCEGGGSISACLEKGDRLFVVDGCWGVGIATTPDANPNDYFGDVTNSCTDSSNADKSTGNLYTINKIYTQPFSPTTEKYDSATTTSGHYEDRFVIEVDYNIAWDGSTVVTPTTPVVITLVSFSSSSSHPHPLETTTTSLAAPTVVHVTVRPDCAHASRVTLVMTAPPRTHLPSKQRRHI